jgi:hypothetical protein
MTESKKAYYRERYRKKAMSIERTCKNCHKSFYKYKGLNDYCSDDCKKERISKTKTPPTPEKQREYSKRYKTRHSVEVYERTKSWRRRNSKRYRDYQREYQRRWRAKNPDKFEAILKRHLAKKTAKSVRAIKLCKEKITEEET